MSPEQQTAPILTELLDVLRREFYPRPADSKKFFRDRTFLMRVITQPAAYLHKHGAKLPAANYRRIIMTVIETIKAKGNRDAIEYFPRYLLTCVQTHMDHHGERYYYAGKTLEGRSVSPRQVSETVAGALKALGRAGGQGDQTVPIAAEVHRVLTMRGRKRAKTADSGMELPGLCNRGAKRAG
jgi:hypothetical protein